MPDKTESYVNCPDCGELVQVVLSQLDDEFANELESIGRLAGLGEAKSTHFYSIENKCKCGKIINVSIHVTAM